MDTINLAYGKALSKSGTRHLCILKKGSTRIERL